MNKLQDDVRDYMTEWLHQYINHYCIHRVPPGEPFLPGKIPGTTYSWQFYLRRGLFNSTFLNYVGCLFWDRFAEEYRSTPFQIAGMETGSTPIIVGLTMTAALFEIEVNSFSIRAERKKYGLMNMIEGIPNNLPVMVVDDLCNSKNTILRSKQVIEEEGLDIYKTFFTIVNKKPDKTNKHDKYIGDDVDIHSLFYLSDFDTSWGSYNLKRELTITLD